MPDSSQVQPVAFNCEGGLVLNRSTFMMKPGEALELQNFEPDIEGGYRRINGFTKLVTNIVPQTSASTEAVLLSIKFNDNDMAGLFILSKYVMVGLPPAMLNSSFKEEPSDGTNEHSLIINLFSIIL